MTEAVTDYICRICTRDPAHPLAEQTVLEFGVPSGNPQRFVEAVQNLAGMLRELKTPERVAAFMRENQALGQAKILTGAK